MKNRFSKSVIYLFILLFSIAFILAGYFICKPDNAISGNEEYYTATVLTVGETVVDEYSYDGASEDLFNKTVYFTAELTSGGEEWEGTRVDAQQYINYALSIQPKEIKVGDEVVLFYSSGYESEEKLWQFAEKNRSKSLLLFCLSFLLLILLIGGRKGVSTIIALLFTVAAIFLVYIPSILKGMNIYATTIIICIFIIVMSLLLLNGINKKSLCAILGNVGGVLVAGILALIMSSILGITGDVEEDYLLLMQLNEGFPIDLKAIVWGSILIGSLGAVMDVAMSISSALQELSENMENKTFGKLLKSGMNIGRDAIGTMTNTLILAYIGGSMATVLLLMAYNMNVLYLFNLEMIVVEVLQAVVGSMGILFAVPSTALIAAYIYTKK